MSRDPKLRLALPQGRLGGGLVVALGGVVALGVLLYWTSTSVVGPDEFAIKQVQWGPTKGIHDEIYGPGMHLVFPGVEMLHRFPRDVQILNFNDNENVSENHVDTRNTAAIRIQTSDGYQVTVDATVVFRIVDPYRVVTKVGFGRAYEDTVVRPRADKILRQTLGTLDAEDFFDDQLRVHKAEECRQALRQNLDDWGIQVFAVLVRSYRYDDRFQSIIEAKKIEDQRLFKNQAERIREERKAERDTLLAKWDADIAVLRQEGDKKIRTINADADLYSRQKLAEGGKALQLAEADGQKWERDALEAAGASNLVGLRMADALENVEVIVVSTTGPNAVNPLDLDTLVEGW